VRRNCRGDVEVKRLITSIDDSKLESILRDEKIEWEDEESRPVAIVIVNEKLDLPKGQKLWKGFSKPLREESVLSEGEEGEKPFSCLISLTTPGASEQQFITPLIPVFHLPSFLASPLLIFPPDRPVKLSKITQKFQTLSDFYTQKSSSRKEERKDESESKAYLIFQQIETVPLMTSLMRCRLWRGEGWDGKGGGLGEWIDRKELEDESGPDELDQVEAHSPSINEHP
jgi:hypothetical protein